MTDKAIWQSYPRGIDANVTSGIGKRQSVDGDNGPRSDLAPMSAMSFAFPGVVTQCGIVAIVRQWQQLPTSNLRAAWKQQLSRTTGRSRNTVRRYVRGGEAAATRKPAPKRVEKLDPFKDYIVGRMAAAAPDRIPATVLLREILLRG